MLPIHIRRLSFRPQGRCVLDQLDVTIPGAGITAVIGPSGAGKSVFLRLLDGLIQPDGGSIRYNRSTAMAIRRAFIFQKPALIRASVADNVALGLAALPLARAERRRRVEAALARVGLADRATHAALRLSCGEQQRLALAQACVTEPELMLVDEPTAALDASAAEHVERLLMLQRDHGVKIILVSHNLGQVARLAEDVLVLVGGRVAEHGPVRQVLSHPNSADARRYLAGEIPWLSFAAA